MIYFLEMISGKDIKNPVELIKIGFSNNFKERIKVYNTTCPAFKVIKTLDGKGFNRR